MGPLPNGGNVLWLGFTNHLLSGMILQAVLKMPPVQLEVMCLLFEIFHSRWPLLVDGGGESHEIEIYDMWQTLYKYATVKISEKMEKRFTWWIAHYSAVDLVQLTFCEATSTIAQTGMSWSWVSATLWSPFKKAKDPVGVVRPSLVLLAPARCVISNL